jgi:signal transduction histidine kinase
MSSSAGADVRAGPGLDALPRLERLLLAAELGAGVVRDRLVDLALFAFAALAAAATAVNGRDQVSTAVFAINLALAVPACLSLWLRRRHPVGVAWLAACLAAISSASVHAAQVATFSVAIHAQPRRALQATALVIAATAVECTIYTPAGTSFNWDFFTHWTANTVAAFALGSFVRVRRQLVVSLHDHSRRLESEQRLRIRDARLTERARIAREMHDVLAHRISLLSVHAGALEVRPDASPDQIARAAGVIRVSARAAQEELREVLGVLRTDPEAETSQPPQPTFADLADLIEESRRAGMDVTLDDRLADRPPAPLTGRTVYRVVQEALTNARKHAPGQLVSISLAGDPGTDVQVEVVNRPPVGGGVDQPFGHVGSGTGLVGLAERLVLAKGTLEQQPLPGGGFRLSARIPWPLAEEEW